MKVKSIRAIPLRGMTPPTGWDHEVDPQDDMQTLVQVETDEGLVGVGSCFTSGALVEAALKLIRPWLVGESAIEPERVSEKLHQMSFWQGRGGAVTHAISGIDMALWDLLGKVTGQPVARRLGGYYRKRIKPYGSILFDEPGRLREKLEEVVSRGFRAIKLGWRPFGRKDRRTDELLVCTARETVGPDVELMVDAGGSEQFWPHSYKWALETARMLSDYGVVWFEEPLPPDDIDNYIKLREHAPLMISAGEVLTRRQSFRPWLERGAVDIIQPDCSKVGGLSEARRIAWMASDHNVLFVPHGWNNAVGLAADLQLIAALPVARWVEYLTPSAYIEEITTTPFELDDEGMLVIPERPGLGVELDPERLARYSAPSPA
ncbi:MAG TPA: mandelate racemase/muconate lactonizing enzyme family protein [Limnochordia bacterium]